MIENRFYPGLHRIAILTAAATFPLIFMGGLVTSHGAGMSVPDWPNSYGYNMFLFPPRLWVGGILYEHTHRLAGTVVGMLSILLTIWAWKYEPRAWVRWLASGVLAAVIFQGVLGGLRVVMVELDLAIVHACFAQAFFCLTALMIAATSRWWHERNELTPSPGTPGDGSGKSDCPRPGGGESSTLLARLAIIAASLIYLQLIAGAVMRHYNAGLAIPDLPLAYGQWLPPATSAGLAEVNHQRAFDPHLEIVTLGQVWVHFAHRVGAVVVTFAILAMTIQVFRRHAHDRILVRPAILALALLVVQITLGVLTVLWRKPADLASAHVAVGALTLFVTFTIAVRSRRALPLNEPVGFPAADRAFAPIGKAVPA